jgi:large subunit ribosomal protein L21
MYAIIETGGKQYRVQEGDTLKVELLPAAPGEEVQLDDVRLISGEDGKVHVGSPKVEGAQVTAKVLDHVRAPKVIVFKMKRRKNYRRRNGHRQGMTVLKISKISA